MYEVDLTIDADRRVGGGGKEDVAAVQWWRDPALTRHADIQRTESLAYIQGAQMQGWSKANHI